MQVSRQTVQYNIKGLRLKGNFTKINNSNTIW